MQIRLKTVGITGVTIEIVGIILLGLDPILSPAIYAIGLIIILFYAHSFKLVEPRLTIYYKYIIYSFLLMIISLIAYSILSALYPDTYETLYMLLIFTGVFAPSITYGLAYIGAYMHVDLPLRTFLLGITYCIVGATNLLISLRAAPTAYLLFLIIIAILIKAFEGWVIAGYPDTVITRPKIRSITATILLYPVIILIILSLLATTNSMIYALDKENGYVHTDSFDPSDTTTYILYIGGKSYRFLVNRGFTYRSVVLSPPATLIRLDGFYQPVFRGYTSYYGVIAPEIIYYHLHVNLDYYPRDTPGIDYTVLTNSSSAEKGTSYSIMTGKMIEPLTIHLGIPGGNYVVSAILAVKGDMIGKIELVTRNVTIEISPGKHYLVRTSSLYVVLSPASIDELGYIERSMKADLYITLYRMNPEPVPGILVLHYSRPTNYMVPLGAALIMDAIT